MRGGVQTVPLHVVLLHLSPMFATVTLQAAEGPPMTAVRYVYTGEPPNRLGRS
jgi:hypothetical protein